MVLAKRLVILVLCSTPLLAQATLLVPSQHPTIQAALVAASNGDTILVAPGTYTVGQFTTSSLVTIRGSGPSLTTMIGGPYPP